MVIKLMVMNFATIIKCSILWFRQEETFKAWSFMWARIVREEIIVTRHEVALI